MKNVFCFLILTAIFAVPAARADDAIVPVIEGALTTAALGVASGSAYRMAVNANEAGAAAAHVLRNPREAQAAEAGLLDLYLRTALRHESIQDDAIAKFLEEREAAIRALSPAYAKLGDKSRVTIDQIRPGRYLKGSPAVSVARARELLANDPSASIRRVYFNNRAIQDKALVNRPVGRAGALLGGITTLASAIWTVAALVRAEDLPPNVLTNQDSPAKRAPSSGSCVTCAMDHYQQFRGQ